MVFTKRKRDSDSDEYEESSEGDDSHSENVNAGCVAVDHVPASEDAVAIANSNSNGSISSAAGNGRDDTDGANHEDSDKDSDMDLDTDSDSDSDSDCDSDCDFNPVRAELNSISPNEDTTDKLVRKVKHNLKQTKKCCDGLCTKQILDTWGVMGVICQGTMSDSVDNRKTAAMGAIASGVINYKLDSKRITIRYSLPNFPHVCSIAFRTFLNLSRAQVKGLVRRLRHGLWFCGYEHGLTGAKSNRALLTQTECYVIEWILDLAVSQGSMDPQRRFRRYEGKNGLVVQYLPSIITCDTIEEQFNNWLLDKDLAAYKAEVERCTVSAEGEPPAKRPKISLDDNRIDMWPAAVSRSTLARLFRTDDRLAHVKFRNPKSDVCDDCAAFYTQQIKIRASNGIILGATELTEAVVKEWTIHNDKASLSRVVWKREVEESKNTCPFKRNDDRSFSKIEGRNWEDWLLCLSFDFAQQLEVPNCIDTVGSFFFMSLLSFKLFGIMNDGLGVQTNFIMAEGDTKKGANVVITLLEMYLNWILNVMLGVLGVDPEGGSVQDVKHLRLHADNCIGQNKNNVMLGLCLWMVSSTEYKFEDITLKFMVKGHTKFSPDGAFGHIKKEYKKHNVYVIDEAIEVINKSAVSNRAHEIKQGDVKQWAPALQTYFGKLKHITKYHEFRFTRANPGVVEVRDGDGEDWTPHNLWNHNQVPQARTMIPANNLAPVGTTVNGTSHVDLKSVFDNLRNNLLDENGPGIGPLKRNDLWDKLLLNVPAEPASYRLFLCPEPAIKLPRAQLLRAHQQAKVDKRKSKNPNAALLMDDDDDDDSGETQEAQERRILMAYLKEQEAEERRAEEMRTDN